MQQSKAGRAVVQRKEKDDNYRAGYLWADHLISSNPFQEQAKILEEKVKQEKLYINSDSIKELTLYLNQGSGTGLDKEIRQAILNLKMNNLNASTIRGYACVAASLYILLRLSGASVGSFSDFYSKNAKEGYIRPRDAFVFIDKVQNIIKLYPPDNKQRVLERVEDYKTFIELLKKGDVILGMLRIKSGHTMNVYKHKTEYYVSDVGNYQNHGKNVKLIVGNKGENFINFEYLK